MFRFMKMLNKEYEHYLDPSFEFDARVAPSALLTELTSAKDPAQLQSFMNAIRKSTGNGMKILRTLTVLHLLLMYSNEFYNTVEKLIPLKHSCTDQWLLKNVIQPYTHFLQKICCSRQIYARSKEVKVWESSFERLFCLINLLNELFVSVKKQSMLGRYYKAGNQTTTSTFVNVVAVQAARIYKSFTKVLSQMIHSHKTYVSSPQQEELMKTILTDSLPQINEEMKKLLLDQYFSPYNKGIGVRLFVTEDQYGSCAKIIGGIISDHQQTSRKRQLEELEHVLFPQQGKFDEEVYQQSLKLNGLRTSKCSDEVDTDSIQSQIQTSQPQGANIEVYVKPITERIPFDPITQLN